MTEVFEDVAILIISSAAVRGKCFAIASPRISFYYAGLAFLVFFFVCYSTGAFLRQNLNQSKAGVR